MPRKSSVAFSLLLALTLAACGSSLPPVQAQATNSPLPPPTRADLNQAGQEYIIGPFDELDINVFGIEDLTRKVRVDAGGAISFPLAGEVPATGTTTQELRQRITEALRRRGVRDPQVSVNITEVVSQTVTVEGEVRKPGNFPVVGRTSLLRMLAQAEGTTQFARMSHVLVYRIVNGQRMVALYDVRAVRRGLYADPDLYANDVVSVGTSEARRVFGDVVAATGLLTIPLTLLVR